MGGSVDFGGDRHCLISTELSSRAWFEKERQQTVEYSATDTDDGFSGIIRFVLDLRFRYLAGFRQPFC